MTREYARVKVKIWADTDFRDLTDPAQSLYFRLLSSPTMNLCGVADWRPKRIAALTRGVTPGDVEAAAQELAERGYIVVDEDTEEVLIRSFVRHDGLIKTPNIAASMAKDYAGTASALLRGVIVFELVRMKADEPSMKGWAVVSHLLSEPSINPSGIPSTKASGMASPNASDDAYPNPSGNGSHIPQPSSLNPQPKKKDSLSEVADAPSDQDFREDIERLCQHLADRIEQNGSKRPTVNASWRRQCRLLLDKDGRTEEQVRKAIDWSQADPFWMANILSMPKLRERYDQLRLKASERPRTPLQSVPSREHFTPPPAPDDTPTHLVVKWNLAWSRANREGRPGPSDWRQLEAS
jgi:hypothetical protein